MGDQPAKQRREVLMARRELANAQRLLTEAMAKARLAGDLLAKALDKDPDTGPPDNDPEAEPVGDLQPCRGCGEIGRHTQYCWVPPVPKPSSEGL